MPSQQLLVGTPTTEIPRVFARRFPDAIGPDDAGRLLAGPRSLIYWDTWDSVLGYARVRPDTWLRFEGDLYLVWKRPVYQCVPVPPWLPGQQPSLNGWLAFSQALTLAAQHYAEESPNLMEVSWYTQEAAWVAICNGWPYFALRRAIIEGGFAIEADFVFQSVFNLLGAE